MKESIVSKRQNWQEAALVKLVSSNLLSEWNLSSESFNRLLPALFIERLDYQTSLVTSNSLANFLTAIIVAVL